MVLFLKITEKIKIKIKTKQLKKIEKWKKTQKYAEN